MYKLKVLFHRHEMKLNSKEYVNYCFSVTKKLSNIVAMENIYFLGYEDPMKINLIDGSTYDRILDCILDDDLKYEKDLDGSFISDSGFLSSWQIRLSEESSINIRYTLGAGERSNLGNNILIDANLPSEKILESNTDRIWSETIKFFHPERARVTCSDIDRELNPDLGVDFNLGVVNYFSENINLESFKEEFGVEVNMKKFSKGTEFLLENGFSLSFNKSTIENLKILQKYMIDNGYISDDDGF